MINEILERLSALEHEQWQKWSETVWKRLNESKNDCYGMVAIDLEHRWKPNWIPYAELPEDVKEHDRKWARKVLEIMRCGEHPEFQMNYCEKCIDILETKAIEEGVRQAEVSVECICGRKMTCKQEIEALKFEVKLWKEEIERWKGTYSKMKGHLTSLEAERIDKLMKQIDADK